MPPRALCPCCNANAGGTRELVAADNPLLMQFAGGARSQKTVDVRILGDLRRRVGCVVAELLV